MTNKTNDVLYIGFTNDIVRRKWEHQNHIIKGFSYKYNLEKCVYVEECGDIIDAIRREKQLKHWNRGKKYCLVKTINPEWNDLIVFDDKG